MRLSFASALLYGALIAPINAQQSQSVSTYHAGEGQTQQGGTESSPTFVKIVGAQTATEKAAEDQRRDDAEAKVKNREILLTLFIAVATIAQAAAAFVMVCIYRKQSKLMARALAETRKAATAAEDGANAALRNTKALVASERPWLLIEVNDQARIGHEHVLHFAAKNYGNSPAEILFSAFKYAFLPSGDNLPEEPNLWANIERYEHTRWLHPTGTHFIGELPLNIQRIAPGESIDTMEEIRTGKRWVWLYGIVKYRGLLRDEAYQSRFCYLWTPVGRFVMDGPAGYNECT